MRLNLKQHRLPALIAIHGTFIGPEKRWNGIKNGMLHLLCVENGFELVLTIDKNLMHQQNLDSFYIILAILNSLTRKVEELKLSLSPFIAQVNGHQNNKTYLIDK